MKILKSEEGFSLLEVLIAITILTVALLGLGLMQVTAIRANRDSYQFGQASALAEQVLEQMKAAPFDNIATSGGIAGGSPILSETAMDALPSAQKAVVNGVTYYQAWDVAGTDPKKITTYVVWRDRIGTWHTVSMKTSRSSL
jgi:prepilin-type N-terminal cleavage/methylation domain-containing protein